MTDTFDCDNTTLKYGDKNETVGKLQRALQSLGYYLTANDDGATLKVDNDFKKYTKEELIDFQKDNGITKSSDLGIFKGDTCKKLNELLLKKDGVTVTDTKQTTKKNTAKKEEKKNPIVVINKKFTTFMLKSTLSEKKELLDLELESNLRICGVPFVISNVTYDTPFTTGAWNSIELLNGKNYVYKGRDVPRAYTLETYLHHSVFLLLQSILEDFTHDICFISSDDEIGVKGNFLVTVTIANEKVQMKKVTFKLTEYMGVE